MAKGTITLDEAQALVRSTAAAVRAASPRATERCPLADSLERVLASDHRAEGPWPSTDRSAMDGFALSTGGAGARAGQDFELRGESLAGVPFDGSLEKGSAVRIMTGGVVPEGADAVARVEDSGGFTDGATSVQISTEVAVGANIRPLGSEVAAGQILMTAGRRIGPAEVGALAVLGCSEVEVLVPPRLRIASTGDEVVELHETPLPHQVRDSNSWAVLALAREAGASPERLGIVPDRADELERVFARGLEGEIFVTIGGVSKGTHDLVHTTLEGLGVETLFHGIAMKPGKPTYFGRKRREDGSVCLVFGLPGNPQSTFATFQMLVAEAIGLLLGEAADPGAGRDAGRELLAVAGGTPWRRNWREQIVPAKLQVREDGQLAVDLARLKPSGDPFGLLDGTVFARVPGDADPETPRVLRVVTGGGLR